MPASCITRNPSSPNITSRYPRKTKRQRRTVFVIRIGPRCSVSIFFSGASSRGCTTRNSVRSVVNIIAFLPSRTRKQIRYRHLRRQQHRQNEEHSHDRPVDDVVPPLVYEPF